MLRLACCFGRVFNKLLDVLKVRIRNIHSKEERVFKNNGKYKGNFRYDGTEENKARSTQESGSEGEAHHSPRFKQAEGQETFPRNFQAVIGARVEMVVTA